MEEEETLRNLLNDFSQVEGYKVLVHGGGRSATKLAAQLGIESKMVGGRRITDVDMLKVVTMVYGGLVNKNIVAGLQALGINALGLTGADMNLMRSDKRPVGEVDYGFVGDVKEVNADLPGIPDSSRYCSGIGSPYTRQTRTYVEYQCRYDRRRSCKSSGKTF